jgi:hypothetical protein
MRGRTNIYLKDLATGLPVEAVLVDGVTIKEIELIEAYWMPHIENKVEQLRHDNVPREKWPQHLHWDWKRKHKKTSRLLAYHWLGIELEEKMQGLMLLDTVTSVGRLPEQSGKPLIYIHYLATAPWNSVELTSNPQLGWIGRVFIAAAIQISRSEGFMGRLGLHALPQAESYYLEVCGMTNLGQDPSKDKLKYFEMTAAQADKFLE